MKLTDNEIAFLRNINKTEVGKGFTDYCERVISHICDSRNWGKDDTKESVNKAAATIQSLIVDKIKLQSKPKAVVPNEME